MRSVGGDLFRRSHEDGLVGGLMSSQEKEETRDFPGGPAAKTPSSQFRGLRFAPWLGNHTP